MKESKKRYSIELVFEDEGYTDEHIKDLAVKLQDILDETVWCNREQTSIFQLLEDSARIIQWDQ